MEALLLIIILIVIIAPFSLFIHEIGHVIGAKLMAATKILLTIGVGNILWSISFQNIDIYIRRVFIVNSFTSTVRDQPFTKKEKVFITFMGPLFSGVLAFISYGLYYSFSSNLYLYVLFLFNAWLVLINLLPFKIGQKQSDGYTILHIILQRLRS